MGYVLYDYLSSGNGYKCRLTMKALGIPYEYRHRDIIAGETRTPEFLAINPNGKIPVLVVPGRGPIAESHAIISYLAEGTKLMPTDKYERALVWQWLCFEQYQLEPGVATLRFWLKYLKQTPEELGERQAKVFSQASEDEVREIMKFTDTVAEIQNTLRVLTPVKLDKIEVIKV